MSHIRVDLPNTNNKWVEFGLANIDTFIIRIGFGLENICKGPTPSSVGSENAPHFNMSLWSGFELSRRRKKRAWDMPL